MTQVEIQVQGMHCQKCAGKVETALVGVVGVSAAQVDLSAHKVLVYLTDNVGMSNLMDAVKQAGFQPVGFKKL